MNISSKNKKIVVFSDWHQESDKLRKILKAESDADAFLDLGDEFDSFDYDSDYDVQKAAELRQEMLWNDKFTVLWGNHTVSYAFEDNKYTKCSGYQPRKQRVINKVLGAEDYTKFKWFCWVDSYLCSHAGINTYFLPPNIKITKKGITDWLTKQSNDANIKISTGQSHWFYRAGYSRGGDQKVGGLVWQDFDTEFEPIEGIKQLLGHSCHTYMTCKGRLLVRQDGTTVYSSDILLPNSPKSSWGNIGVDCNLNQWLVIENGEMVIRDYKNL